VAESCGVGTVAEESDKWIMGCEMCDGGKRVVVTAVGTNLSGFN
jgi:hypothetical protein